MWTVYILQCRDGTLYTGITDNLPRRLAAHNGGKGAKYTGAGGLWSWSIRNPARTAPPPCAGSGPSKPCPAPKSWRCATCRTPDQPTTPPM